MKYKVQVCIYGEVVEEKESNSLKEMRDWWRKRWKRTEDYGGCFCEWFIDGKYQDIPQKIRLEGEK